MAVIVHLWVKGNRLVGGAEQWWDDVESTLQRADGFPLLRAIDPYGVTILDRDSAKILHAEVEQFRSVAPRGLQPFLTKLLNLCEDVERFDDSVLRFEGD